MPWFKSMVSPAVADRWPWQLGSILNLCVSFLVDNGESGDSTEPGRWGAVCLS